MIAYRNLKEWLLKAISLSKPHARRGLVLVKRPVSRQSGTKMEYRWVRPDQVETTDHVLAGHHNLLQGHPQRPTKVRSADDSTAIPEHVKQATDNFYQLFSNDDAFFHALQELTITWKRDFDKPGKDLERAKLALNNAQLNGLNLSTYPLELLGITTQSKQTSSKRKPTKSTKDANSPSKTDPTLIKIPKSASPTKRALGELINKMTDVNVINQCFLLRAVPEDKIAQDYMLNTALPELKEWIKSASYTPSLSASVEQFLTDMETIGESSDIIRQHSVEDTLNKKLSVQGCKLSLITESMSRELQRYNMDVFTHPQDYIQPPHQSSTHQGTIISPMNLISSLGGTYQDYTDDAEPHGTNRGYSGNDSDVYKNRYDPNKEGFVRILQRIKQENRSNTNIGLEVDDMIADYNNMMKLADYDPYLLGQVLQQRSYGSDDGKFDPYDFGSRSYNSSFASIKKTLEGAEIQTNVVLKTLQDRGYSTKDIVNSLGRNNNLSDYRIYNSQTGQDDFINMRKEVDPVTGKTIAETTGNSTNKSVMLYALIKLQQQKKLNESDVGHWYTTSELNTVKDWLKSAQQKSTITPERFQQIQDLSYKIFGYNIEHVPISEGSSYTKSVVTTNHNDARKVILSNLLMVKAFNDVASRVARFVASNNNPSKFNNQGQDYSGNFDFYDGTGMEASDSSTTTFRRQYYSSATYTATELSNKITQQLQSVPLYSAEYIRQVNQLYEKKSADNPSNIPAKDFAHNDNFMVLPYGKHLLDSPVKDVVYNTTIGLLHHVPNMAKDPNLSQKIAQKLGYAPYDFSLDVQPHLDATIDPTDLKAARERLFKVANCSLASLTLKKSNKLQDEIRNKRFDYAVGEKDPEGRKVYNQPWSDTTCFFNSRVFAINNSTQQEKYRKKQAALKAKCTDPECYTPIPVFHGCSRSAAGSIIMRDGKFYMSGEYKKTAHALGLGAYFAYKAGKSARYLTNGKFALFNRPGSPEGSNGCYLLCEVMRGEKYSKTNTGQQYTSVSAGVNKGWEDWEICIRDNSLICPLYVVDASCCKLEKVGITQDEQGNYVDEEGTIMYDSYGRNLNIK